MKIKILRSDIHRLDLKTRMPFRYGIATMTHVPAVFVRLWVEIDGKEWAGISSDCLAPKWFTKDPNKPLAEENGEMLRVIKQALSVSIGLRGDSAFDLWKQIYEAQSSWGKAENVPPLLCHFGSFLAVRAF